MPLAGKTPVLTPRTFVAPRYRQPFYAHFLVLTLAHRCSASVIGDVSIGENSSVWYNAVVSGTIIIPSHCFLRRH